MGQKQVVSVLTVSGLDKRERQISSQVAGGPRKITLRAAHTHTLTLTLRFLSLSSS